MKQLMKPMSFCVVLSSAMMLGCDRETPKTAAPSTNASATTKTTANTSLTTQKSIGGATTRPSIILPTTTAAGTASGATTKETGKTTIESAEVKEAKADIIKNADSKISEVTHLVTNGKIADAETALNKLEQVKSSLSEPVQVRLGEARKAFNAAKTLQGEIKPADLTNLNK